MATNPFDLPPGADDPAEEAAVPFDPGVEDPALQAAQTALEAQVMEQDGVLGVGIGTGPTGDDALTVYVRDRSVAARLPKSVQGYAVIAEVVGSIDAQ